MIELFSGIGAQIKGTNNTGLFDTTVIATADIEKDASHMLQFTMD